MFEIEKKKKKSVAYEAKWDSNIAAFPQFYHLLCGSWISEGLVVWAEGGGGENMFSLHELPANPLIKHANGCNCCWW